MQPKPTVIGRLPVIFPKLMHYFGYVFGGDVILVHRNTKTGDFEIWDGVNRLSRESFAPNYAVISIFFNQSLLANYFENGRALLLTSKGDSFIVKADSKTEKYMQYVATNSRLRDIVGEYNLLLAESPWLDHHTRQESMISLLRLPYSQSCLLRDFGPHNYAAKSMEFHTILSNIAHLELGGRNLARLSMENEPAISLH